MSTLCCAYTHTAHKAVGSHKHRSVLLSFSHSVVSPEVFVEPAGGLLTSVHGGSLESDRSKHAYSATTSCDNRGFVPWESLKGLVKNVEVTGYYIQPVTLLFLI